MLYKSSNQSLITAIIYRQDYLMKLFDEIIFLLVVMFPSLFYLKLYSNRQYVVTERLKNREIFRKKKINKKSIIYVLVYYLKRRHINLVTKIPGK